jgi:hypothetical protein
MGISPISFNYTSFMKNNKTLIYILLLLYFVFSYSCKNRLQDIYDNENFDTIAIARPFNASEIYLSDIFDTVKIINLQFTKNCILSEIRKIVIHNNRIYIQDKQNENGIFLFDISGQFLNKIGERGNGPQEHLTLTDFSIDYETEDVYIYSNAQRKIFRYSNDNTFCKEYNIEHPADFFEYHLNHFFLYRDNPQIIENYNLILKDTTGITIKGFFKSIPKNRSFSKPVFSKNGEELLFHRAIYDDVYSIDLDFVERIYYVDYGKSKTSDLERAEMEKVSTNILDLLTKNKIIAGFNNFIETENTIYFNYTYQIVQHHVFYFRDTGKLLNSYNIIDDITGLFFYAPICQYDNNLVSVYYPSKIENNIKQLKKNGDKYLTKNKINRTLRVLNNVLKLDISKINPSLVIYENN